MDEHGFGAFLAYLKENIEKHIFFTLFGLVTFFAFLGSLSLYFLDDITVLYINMKVLSSYIIVNMCMYTKKITFIQ